MHSLPAVMHSLPTVMHSLPPVMHSLPPVMHSLPNSMQMQCDTDERKLTCWVCHRQRSGESPQGTVKAGQNVLRAGNHLCGCQQTQARYLLFKPGSYAADICWLQLVHIGERQHVVVIQARLADMTHIFGQQLLYGMNDWTCHGMIPVHR